MAGPRSALIGSPPQAEAEAPPTAAEPDGDGARAAVVAGFTVAAGAGVLVLALLLSEAAPQAVNAGLPDAGRVTGWALPLTRLGFDIAAVGTVGALLVAAVLAPAADAVARRAVRASSWWATGWAAAAVVLLALSLSDILGVTVPDVLSGDVLLDVGWSLPQGRALLLVLAVTAVLATCARWTTTRAGAGGLLGLALVGLLPVAFTGHAAQVADPDLATTSLLVHVVAASLWLGGLVGMLWHLRRTPEALVAAVPRFSRLALVCFVLVGGSGLLTAWTRLADLTQIWTTAYGGILLAKLGALALLGGFGWWHRTRTLAHLQAGRPRAFLRLAVGEVVVMAATIGLAVALSRTPPPPATVVVPEHGVGHPTLGQDVEPFTVLSMVTQWRPDALALVAIALGLGAYALGIRRLAARGQRWPVWRTAAASAAAVVALFALCGGLAAYSTALMSVQVGQLITLAVVVPALVAVSAPLALALSVRDERFDDTGPTGLVSALRSRPAQVLGDPVNALGLLVVLVVVLYATPLLELSMRNFAVHLVVGAVAVAAGGLFFWGVLGADPTPQPRSRRDRVLLLSALLVGVALLGVGLARSGNVIAAAWFFELDWAWADPVADQRRAAGLAWVFVYAAGPLLLAAQLLPPADVLHRAPRAGSGRSPRRSAGSAHRRGAARQGGGGGGRRRSSA